jgi:threonine/homoserine/homoserine lactone efflux protein
MYIDTANIPLFLSAIFALLIVPGPDSLLITSQAISRGAVHGVACALGIAAAGVIQTVLVAIGLGKIMEAWPAAANGVRMVGAFYLAVLGGNLILSWWRKRREVDFSIAQDLLKRSVVSLFLAGLVNNLLNPKALLFFSVFIPQFVNPLVGPSSVQIAILGAILTIIALLYNLALALAFSQFRHLDLRNSFIARNSDGMVGTVFLFVAGKLAFSRST